MKKIDIFLREEKEERRQILSDRTDILTYIQYMA